MSTALAHGPAWRIAWKEYRVLRGLWLAALLLGLLVDWLSGVLMTPQIDFASLRLGVALATSTLYAAGAAAILFSMEHEEQTYDFLRVMPTTWLPIFSGKFLLATTSAMGLAAVLTVAGQLATGSNGLRTDEALLAAGIFGIAIFEALAWGTLCSLLLKRPLAAAVATLLVGAVFVNVAVTISAGNDLASADPRAYTNAIPLRLAIVLSVMCAAVMRARGWLGANGLAFSWPLRADSSQGNSAGARGGTIAAVQARLHVSRRTMLARLLWQSWRESWKMLLLPVALAATCLFGSAFVGHLWPGQGALGETIALATIFFGPALYGALAFAADQRRDHVRFLAEHAAAPRYIWLSRHIVWLGALSVVVLAVTILFSAAVVKGIDARSQQYARPMAFPEWAAYQQQKEIREVAEAFTSYASLATWGVLTAYSLGQLCSMLLRSEILASFLALILAALLATWMCVLLVWNLSVWMFLMPLALGLLWATWLRAPSWIAGRNSWRDWIKPVSAIVGGLAMVALMLPAARLAQIGSVPDPLSAVQGAEVNATDASGSRIGIADAAATAEMYSKAASMLQAPVEDDPLAPWSGPEYAAPILGPDENIGQYPYGVDLAKIPEDQFDAFQAAGTKWEALVKQKRQEALELAIQASERPTCRFDFPVSASDAITRSHFPYDDASKRVGQLYDFVDSLERHLAGLPDTGIDEKVSFRRLMAALRMNAHVRASQPAVIYMRQLEREIEILRQIGAWSQSSDLANEERRDALNKLQAFFARPTDLYDAILADERVIGKVIAGRDLPIVLSEDPLPRATYLAYLANEFPWERKRGQLALKLITHQNLLYANELVTHLSKEKVTDTYRVIHNWVRPAIEPPAWTTAQPQAVTSFLVSKEYVWRAPVDLLFRQYVDVKTRENAAVVEMALTMYREDHEGEYPEALAWLSPRYLKREPLDPYTSQPFAYRPNGLDDKLRVHDATDAQQEVSPHTPLFFSTGAEGWQLQRVVEISPGAESAEAGAGAYDEVKGVGEMAAVGIAGASGEGSFYHFVPTAPQAGYAVDPGRLLFLLPR